MQLVLRKELLSYGTSLLVLKRLEANHFLVGLKAHRARAASVPTISAEMRRRFNADHLTEKFEYEFPELLASIGQLTTLPWQSKTQLIQSITQQVNRGLHANMECQHQHFERFRSLLKRQNEERHGLQPRCFDFTLKFQHLTSVLTENWYYGLPSKHAFPDGAADSELQMDIFQVLALNPGLRQYIQRSAYMTEDAAHIGFRAGIFFNGTR